MSKRDGIGAVMERVPEKERCESTMGGHRCELTRGHSGSHFAIRSGMSVGWPNAQEDKSKWGYPYRPGEGAGP